MGEVQDNASAKTSHVRTCEAPGQRWHLPALPTTLARLALRAQARRKEKRPPPPIIHTPVPTRGIKVPENAGV